MAEWSNATMTDVGAALQAKVNAGKTKLTFTKIKVGSGVNATNPLALTDVISSKWETTNFVVKLEGKIVSVDTVMKLGYLHKTLIKAKYCMHTLRTLNRTECRQKVAQ